MAQRRIGRVIQTLQKPSWKPAAPQLFRQRAFGNRQQLVDQTLGKRLCGVDQNELSPLLDDVVGDEGGHANRKSGYPRVPDCSAALLPIYDPTWFLHFAPGRIDWYDQFPASRVSARRTA